MSNLISWCYLRSRKQSHKNLKVAHNTNRRLGMITVKKHIYVAAAVIRSSDNKILIGRRPAGSDMELLWEFPGGKLEANETPKIALKRELKEELNIDAICGDISYEETYAYPDKIITLYFIEITSYKGVVEALIHDELRWVKVDTLQCYDFPPADDDFIKKLIE